MLAACFARRTTEATRLVHATNLASHSGRIRGSLPDCSATLLEVVQQRMLLTEGSDALAGSCGSVVRGGPADASRCLEQPLRRQIEHVCIAPDAHVVRRIHVLDARLHESHADDEPPALAQSSCWSST